MKVTCYQIVEFIISVSTWDSINDANWLQYSTVYTKPLKDWKKKHITLVELPLVTQY